MEKRQAGQIIDDVKREGKKIWLVLSESTGEEGVGFKHKCGAEIQGKRVTHPIWDGPFPLSGSGRVHTETIPFCPQCELEPNSSGAPIDHDSVERREMGMLKRIGKRY